MAIISSRKNRFRRLLWGRKIKGYPKFKWKEKSIKKESEAHNIAKGRVGNIHCLVQKKSLDLKKVFRYLMGIFP